MSHNVYADSSVRLGRERYISHIAGFPRQHWNACIFELGDKGVKIDGELFNNLRFAVKTSESKLTGTHVGPIPKLKEVGPILNIT